MVNDFPSISGRAFDSNITADSTNGITSGAVFTAINEKQNRIDPQNRLNANPIGNGSISNSEFQFLNPFFNIVFPFRCSVRNDRSASRANSA